MSQSRASRAGRDARRRRASQFARLGAAKRRGDSSWGLMMTRKRGGKARAKHYPALVKLWATNAARTRWNKVRAARGLPLLPLLPVPKIMTPRAIEMRERREL